MISTIIYEYIFTQAETQLQIHVNKDHTQKEVVNFHRANRRLHKNTYCESGNERRTHTSLAMYITFELFIFDYMVGGGARVILFLLLLSVLSFFPFLASFSCCSQNCFARI